MPRFTCAVDAEYRSDVPPTIELSASYTGV
jgi:hypothetical protein